MRRSPALTVLYRSNTLRVLCAVICIAMRSRMPVQTRLRKAVRRTAWCRTSRRVRSSRPSPYEVRSAKRFVIAHDKSPVPPPPTLLAGSYLSLLEAIDIFTRQSVNRLTTTLLGLTPREKVILGLYYRSIGFCRTATELKAAVHQQTLTSAERSVIELYVDMELVHRNAIPDAVEKVIAFTDWQKLRAARRIDRFFTDNPGLDTQPLKATPHREFIKNEAARVERDVERHLKPHHAGGHDATM